MKFKGQCPATEQEESAHTRLDSSACLCTSRTELKGNPTSALFNFCLKKSVHEKKVEPRVIECIGEKKQKVTGGLASNSFTFPKNLNYHLEVTLKIT